MNRRIPLKNILITLGFSLATIVILYNMFKDNLIQIITQLKSMSILSVILIILSSFLFQAAEGTITRRNGRKFLPSFTLRDGIGTILYGCFFRGTTFGTGTQLSQMYYLSKKEIPFSESMGMMTSQYIFHKIGLFSYLTVCLFMFKSFLLPQMSSYRVYIFVGYGINLIIILALLLICLSERFHKLLKKTADRLPEKIKTRLPINNNTWQEVSSLRDKTTVILRDKKLLIENFLSEFVKFSCYYIIPAISLWGSGMLNSISINIFEIMALTSLVTILVSVIPVPSGIGATELVYVFLFSPVFGKTASAATMLVYRFATYFLPFIFGILFWIVLKISDAKKLSA